MPKIQSNNTPATSYSMEIKHSEELLKFLLAELKNKSRNKVKFLLANNRVFVNGEVQRQFNFILKPGDRLQIAKATEPRKKEIKAVQTKGFSIVFEDEHLIVINKDAGLLSISTSKEKQKTVYSYLYDYVKMSDPQGRIFIVHRLDRETSGLMVFAKNEKVKKLLQENWTKAVKARSYVALAEGVLGKDNGTIESYLHESKAMVVYSNQNPEGGKLATSNYKVLQRSKTNTLLSINLETGRKNQIRVHMQDLGHPIVNDKKYGASTNPIGRLGLHAQVLRFEHPITKKALHFETEIPSKFSQGFRL